MLLALFCAAQAPELVSRDQHNRVLPLYFSRALRQHDYAAAKLLAMWTAVFLLVLTPLLIILAGRLGLPADFGAAFKAESEELSPHPGHARGLRAGVRHAVHRRWRRSSRGGGWPARWCWALFMLTLPLAGILMEAVEARWRAYGVLINPMLAANGAILALFNQTAGARRPAARGEPARGGVRRGRGRVRRPLRPLLFNRYRRISA